MGISRASKDVVHAPSVLEETSPSSRVCRSLCNSNRLSTCGGGTEDNTEEEDKEDDGDGDGDGDDDGKSNTAFIA